MNEHYRKVELRVGGPDAEARTVGKLLVCPSCRSEVFHVFQPAGIDHVHFQCFSCGITYCDGCVAPTIISLTRTPKKKGLPT